MNSGGWYCRWGKRVLDVGVAAGALVLLMPVGIALAVVVRVWLGAPVLFRQARPGRDGRLFSLVKFRSMTDARDVTGQLRPDADRLVPLGRFLRRTSLDELPELWNVLVGEMSLVGPRPLLPEYLPLYSPEQARRHAVRPGITGWAQVHGRNALSWDEKFHLDVWYVDHVSLWRDLHILALTVRSVVRRDGISASAHVTMPRFEGNDR
jgi:sugar transferase EpsL